MRRRALLLAALAAASAGPGARAEDEPSAVELLEDAPDAPPAPRASALPSPGTRASPMSGAIAGRVLWTSAPPEPAELSRNAEPYCARLGTQLDPALSVSAGGLAHALLRVHGWHAADRRPAAAGGAQATGQAGAGAQAGAGGRAQDDAAAPAELSLSSCAFAPRVLGLAAGQRLRITSGDPILHSVRLVREQSVVFRRSLERGEPAPELRFNEPGVYRVGCDVHPWEVAWVVVAAPGEAQAFAVTDAQGHFRLEGLAPGSYLIEGWHESATLAAQSPAAVKVRSGQTARASLEARPTPALAARAAPAAR